MKKIIHLACLLVLTVLAAVLCPAAAPAADAAPHLRVALLLEDGAPDQGWNDLLRQGLEQARRELGVSTAVVVAPPQGSDGLSQEAIFRAAARQADLVLLSGARLHEILRDNAANFRQTKFGCIDTGIRAANIMCVTFADEQAAFLAGALLSQLHRHGLLPAPGARRDSGELTLGWLAGEDDPQLKTMLNGFVEGVRLESPGARVINGVAGSYASPADGRARAQELLGMDINALAVLAGRSGLGAVEAAAAAGRPLVGVDRDQHDLAPRLMLTSIVKRADRAVFEIVKATAQGAFAGNEIITYDLANGGVDIVPPQVWARNAGVRLPDAIGRRLAELRLELTRGGIRLPSLRDRTLCNCR
ncbi:BMP family ABC transporter substrate-binding protein [uncultured Desulfovibrio sp.]|uniref:BMP family lipoprotein n=1 Tax=uncultured Desulfovibrio sp. TaxID=167968 RepID=UPI00263052DD|nr:BMP family ABC transporter substrate-binding protein [uncultured Desulfovibrio sp.]